MSASEPKNKSKPDLSDIGLEGYAPYLMNRIMGRYNANLSEKISALGLSVPKLRALAILSIKDGLPSGHLGVLAVVEQSNMSRTIDSLCKQGLARRENDDEDRRSNRVYLTAHGRSVFDELWPHMLNGRDQMFEGIDDAEQDAFLRTLRKILYNVRVHSY